MLLKIIKWFKSIYNSVYGCASNKQNVIAPSVPKQYTEVTYKTELQIVLRNLQVVCTDYTYHEWYNGIEVPESFKDIDMVKPFIDDSFKKGIMHTFDKSNKYHTSITTTDITRVLYKKPTMTSVVKSYE